MNDRELPLEGGSPPEDDLDAILREGIATLRKTPPDGTRAPRMGDLAASKGDAGTAPKPKSTPPSTKPVARPRVRILSPTRGPVVRVYARSVLSSRPLVIAITLGAVAVLMWIMAPGGMGAVMIKPLPTTYTEASSRWALVLASEQIDRFRAEHARLPLSFAEITTDTSDAITYVRLTDDDYRLEAPGKDSVLVLDPSTSRTEFLQSGTSLLRSAPKDRR